LAASKQRALFARTCRRLFERLLSLEHKGLVSLLLLDTTTSIWDFRFASRLAHIHEHCQQFTA
jgi:hypothetical protein